MNVIEAPTPRAAVEQLLAAGVFPVPPGPRTVMRKRMILRRLDDPLGPAPEQESERVVVEGPPFTIDLETVRFLKEREVLGRHLVAVSFDATSNHLRPGTRHEMGRMFMVIPADGRWRVMVGSGVAPSATPPRRPLPSASLGSHWNRAEGFYGAARIYPGEETITSVRLRFQDGNAAEADGEDGLALYYVSPPAGIELRTPYVPDAIELLDGTQVVATQPGRRFPDRPRPA